MKEKKKLGFRFLFVSIIPLLSFIAVVVGTTYAFYTIKVDVVGNDENGGVSLESARVFAMFEATNEIDAKGVLPGYSSELQFSIVNTSNKENLYGRYTIAWEIEKNEIDNNNFVYSIEGTSTKNGENVIESKTNKLINIASIRRIPNVSTDIGSGVINTGVTHNYTLTIHFLESGTNQDAVQGKEFSGKIVAKGV